VGGPCGTHRRGEKLVHGLGESPKEGDHLQHRCVDGRVGLEGMSGRLARRMWSGFTWLRVWTSGGSS
jgi:hypothetical protein